MIASLMPVLTIAVLNQIQSTNNRILMTAVITALFAGAIAAFTQAKRVEIIAATAT